MNLPSIQPKYKPLQSDGITMLQLPILVHISTKLRVMDTFVTFRLKKISKLISNQILIFAANFQSNEKSLIYSHSYAPDGYHLAGPG